MFSLLRLRAPAPAAFLARAATAAVRPLPALRLPLHRALATATEGSRRSMPGYYVCHNCRREGHLRKDCKEPTVCVACGVEGHERKNCPSPDPARLEALKTAPIKCFRCGEEGHGLKDCPVPAKCFYCAQEGHILRDCPTRPPPPVKSDAAPAASA